MYVRREIPIYMHIHTHMCMCVCIYIHACHIIGLQSWGGRVGVGPYLIHEEIHEAAALVLLNVCVVFVVFKPVGAGCKKPEWPPELRHRAWLKEYLRSGCRVNAATSRRNREY